MNKILSKKVALYGVLGAVSLVLNLFDNMISPEMAFLPMGAKLGLSNIVIVVASTISAAGGYYILALKVLFALVTRGATAALMSFCGGVLATTATILMIRKKCEKLSYIGISVLSASLHNAGQLVCAAFISGTVQIFSYGKFLLLFAVITGTITGVVLNILVPRINKATVFSSAVLR